MVKWKSFGKRWLIGLTLSLAITPHKVYGEPIKQHKNLTGLSLKLEIDRSTLTLDESLRFTLSAEVTATTIVQFQAVDETLGPFNVVDRYPRGPLPIAEQRQRWQREYLLQAEQPGEHIIPPLTVVFFESEHEVTRTPCVSADKCQDIFGIAREIGVYLADTRRELSTDPAVIIVTEANPEKVQLSAESGITTILAKLQQDQPLLLLILAGLILLGGGWLLVLRRRNRLKSDEISNTSAVAQPSIVETFEQLQSELSTQHSAEELYHRLNIVIRAHFAAGLTSLQAKTNAELLAQLRQTGSDANRYQALCELLHFCERVKFAGHKPDLEQNRRMFEKAKTLLEANANESI